MRLFNKIVSSPEGRRWLAKMLPDEPQVIVADNVASYYWQGTDQEYWDLDIDFANIAPPFQYCVLDWRAPSRIVSKETGTRPWDTAMPTEFCCSIHGVDLRLPLVGFPETVLSAIRQVSSARWMLVFWVYHTGGILGDDIAPSYSALFFADEHGRPIKATPNTWFLSSIFSEKVMYMINHIVQTAGGKFNDIAVSMLRPTLDVALLTISFMHCKNVSLDLIVPDAKLSKRTHERYGVALHRYHVLNIDPMKTVLRNAAQQDGLILHGKALHICRGHFKDYTQRGLFGKNKGLFWWGQSVKGTVAHGTVEKLYAVSTPRTDGPAAVYHSR